MSASRCAPFWAETPSILWQDAMDCYPFHEDARKCTTTALNSFTRFGIYLGLLLAALYRDGVYLGITLGIAAIALATYYGMKDKGVIREGFADPPVAANTIVAPTLSVAPNNFGTPNLVGGIAAADKPVADVIGTIQRTSPTAANPFMNVLLHEIKENPTKAPAVNIDEPGVRRALSDEFQTRMYGDPGDVFQHSQNQRIWAAQPSTTVPNDRESFQNWLYRTPGRTCKEGNTEACRTGTEGGVAPWLSAP